MKSDKFINSIPKNVDLIKNWKFVISSQLLFFFSFFDEPITI